MKLEIPKELTCNRCHKPLIGEKHEQSPGTICVRCMGELVDMQKTQKNSQKV